MSDFFVKNFSLINDIPLFIAALIGLIVYDRYKKTQVKYFIWFIIYVFLMELIGGYPGYFNKYEILADIKSLFKNTIFEKNYWWYTIFWSIANLVFIPFYFSKILIEKRHKLITKYCSVFFVLISLTVIIFNFEKFFISTYPIIKILDAVIVFVCVALYFVELLKSNHVLEFYKSIHFYIASILFIWWLVTTSTVFFEIYLNKNDPNFRKIRAFTFLFSNIFMYLSFAFALYFCKPKENEYIS